MTRCVKCKIEDITDFLEERIKKATIITREVQNSRNVYAERFNSGLLNAYISTLKFIKKIQPLPEGCDCSDLIKEFEG